MGVDRERGVVDIRPGRLFAAAALAMLVFGVIVALLGTLFGLPETRAWLNADLSRQGDLFSILFGGLLVSTIAAGPAIDRYGSRLVLVSATVTATAGFLLLAAAPGFATAAVAAALLGAGGGWLNTVTNALVSDLYPRDRGRMLNLLGIFFGVGALFVPVLVTAGFGTLSVSGIVLVCAALAAASVAACLGLHFPPPREGAAFSPRGMLAVARDPGVLLLAVLLFFESGNESALSGWTSTYVGSAGWSPRTATVVLLGYWVVSIAGRAVSAHLQARVGKGRLVVLSAALSVVGCVVLLIGSRSLPLLAAGAWLTALGLSAVCPTTLAIAGDRHRRFAGTVFGFLFSVGNMGNVSFPLALGHISQAVGIRFGMILPLAGAVCVTVCASVAAAREARGPGDSV